MTVVPRFKVAARYYSGRLADRLDEAGFPLRRRSLVFFGVRPAEAPRDPRPPQGVALGVVSPARFRSLRWNANAGVRDAAGEFRAFGTQRPVAAMSADEMLGFCWLETGAADLRFFDLGVPLPAGMGYLSRVWVAPSSRGSGIGRALIQQASAEAARLGLREIVSACVPENARMRHLFHEMGWSARGRVEYRRVGPAVLFVLEFAGDRARWVPSTARAGHMIFAS
jgi:GNAT superfamily N-acetyltransferase